MVADWECVVAAVVVEETVTSVMEAVEMVVNGLHFEVDVWELGVLV